MGRGVWEVQRTHTPFFTKKGVEKWGEDDHPGLWGFVYQMGPEQEVQDRRSEPSWWFSHSWAWHDLHLRVCLTTLAPLLGLGRRRLWVGKLGLIWPALLRAIRMNLFSPWPTSKSLRTSHILFILYPLWNFPWALPMMTLSACHLSGWIQVRHIVVFVCGDTEQIAGHRG